MKALIEKITVMQRIRKETTKIAELAENIEKNGLLNPVTIVAVDGDQFQLLAGLRRLKAVQTLGWVEIDVNIVTVVDAEAALEIEISENEQREEFTFSEREYFRKLLEEVENIKAKERMAFGGKGGIEEGCPHGDTLQKGRVSSIVAGKLGMKKTTYDRAKYIAENATPDVIEELDKGERSIRGTYDELRAKEEPAEPKPKKPSTPPVEKMPSETRAAKNDPNFQKIKAEEAEAIRKRKEFEALPPDEKIAHFQQQFKEMRTRAVTAESDLATAKLNYGISLDHKDSIIDSLKQQNENLDKALKAANARIAELTENK